MTGIATATAADIFVRGKNLCGELVGQLSFTEMICFQMLGRVPAPAQLAMIDACLVTLIEHGLTPSVLATRLVYSSAPEALQGAVAAGLLGVGGRFLGTVEDCAQLLARVVAAPDLEAEAARVVDEHRDGRRCVAGFGHTLHIPDDPRTPCLFALARARGTAGKYQASIELISAALDRALGRHVTINATGAVAAVLGDVGIPVSIMRGFALIARCAGLVGHAYEEQQRPVMRSIWEAAEHVVGYDGVPARTSEPGGDDR